MLSVAPAIVGSMATPLKSALKRKHSDITESEENSSQELYASKRAKVQFNEEDNQIEVFKAWSDDKALAHVREEVRRALENHLQPARDSSDYDSLTQLLMTKPQSDDAPSNTLLRRYIIALSGYTSLMGRKCMELVEAVLEIQWLGRDEDTVVCYRRLLVNMIATHGGLAQIILGSLVDKFANLRGSAGRLPDNALVRRSQLLDRVHITLDLILQKVPSALGALKTVLSSSFPSEADSVGTHIDYTTDILKIISYAPALRSDILSLIMDKVVKVDVQIQVDIEDLEDDLQDQLEHSLAEETKKRLERRLEEQDDEESDSDDDDASDIASTMDPTIQRLQDLKNEVTKLDAMIDLLFEHYHPIFAKGTIVQQEAAFDQLISTFSRTILPTYRSRHIQFLLFHYGQALPSLSEQFTNYLIRVVFDKNQAALVKRSAAAYLASFIARGAHVSREIVQNTFTSLGRELERLRQLHERNPNCGPDLHRFGVYYAIAQALLYLFCFRWRDLLRDDFDESDEFDADELEWGAGVKETFDRNVQSPLNPLKVCAPMIVNQFAIVSRHLKFQYLNHKLELNKRIRLTRSMAFITNASGSLGERETALSAKSGEAMFQLDAYFPFDPYNLPRSKRWMTGDSLEWQPVPGMEVDDEDDSESDEEEEDEEEYDEPTETESDAEG